MYGCMLPWKAEPWTSFTPALEGGPVVGRQTRCGADDLVLSTWRLNPMAMHNTNPTMQVLEGFTATGAS